MSRPDSPPPPRLTADQIARWADRIADGRDEFPAGLADPDRSALADAVRRRLRDRLHRHVARAIAARLARPDAPDPRSDRHVDPEVRPVAAVPVRSVRSDEH